MGSTSPRDEVNELALIVETYMPDHMPDKFWEAWGKIVAYAKQAGWPVELHTQYMAVLEERDTLQSQLESLQDEYNELRWRMDSLEK